MGFADRVPSTSGCLQHCGNERKALDPVPKEGEAILNTVVSRHWYHGRIKWGLKWRTRSKIVPYFSALLEQMELNYLGTESYGWERAGDEAGKFREWQTWMRREWQKQELEDDKKQGQEKDLWRPTKIMVWKNESYQKGLESTCKCPCAALSAGWLWLSQSLNISNFYGGVGVFPTQIKCGGGSEITEHQDCTVPLWYVELQPG